MRVKRKNTEQITELTVHDYFTFEDTTMYGYLALKGTKVWFIYQEDVEESLDVTHEFDIVREVKRKMNSEVIDLTEPQHMQHNGVYGYLSTNGTSVHFMYDSDGIQCSDVTHEFYIITASK